MYIPHDRSGNKSGRPRVLPVDSELSGVLGEYLRIRPAPGTPHLFLSRTGRQLRKKRINDIWKAAFHPLYDETDQYRSVTSHFGRHYFTTYWRVRVGLSRPLVKYLRGDGPGSESILDVDGIDQYIHTHYSDVEQPYRANIYHLLSPQNWS